ncbi:hypothetical protein HPP92_018247 [Vanilla planifolia]|uniref:Reverse transcriptase domain-containing protein n=1 Tax=Vanilla planifolia TaxID=51239 RepID=A0A835QCF9_VANPL|nr:hypothetical protein HPP92_018247 [Vanilla planifolia]
MNNILYEYLDGFVVIYLNDIVIYSNSFEEHMVHLSKVFFQLREFQLYVKRKNMNLLRDHVPWTLSLQSPNENRSKKCASHCGLASSNKGLQAKVFSQFSKLLSLIHTRYSKKSPH